MKKILTVAVAACLGACLCACSPAGSGSSSSAASSSSSSAESSASDSSSASSAAESSDASVAGEAAAGDPTGIWAPINFVDGDAIVGEDEIARQFPDYAITFSADGTGSMDLGKAVDFTWADGTMTVSDDVDTEEWNYVIDNDQLILTAPGENAATQTITLERA